MKSHTIGNGPEECTMAEKLELLHYMIHEAEKLLSETEKAEALQLCDKRAKELLELRFSPYMGFYMIGWLIRACLERADVAALLKDRDPESFLKSDEDRSK